MFWPWTCTKRQRTKYDQEFPDDRVGEATAVAINNMTDVPVSQTVQRPDGQESHRWTADFETTTTQEKKRQIWGQGNRENQRCSTRMICKYSTDLSSKCQLAESSAHAERTEMDSFDSRHIMQCSFLHAQKMEKMTKSTLIDQDVFLFLFLFFWCFETAASWRHPQC